MKQGQPALLYLVPCTLGVLCCVAHARGELSDMWHGPWQLPVAAARGGNGGDLGGDWGEDIESAGQQQLALGQELLPPRAQPRRVSGV